MECGSNRDACLFETSEIFFVLMKEQHVSSLYSLDDRSGTSPGAVKEIQYDKKTPSKILKVSSVCAQEGTCCSI